LAAVVLGALAVLVAWQGGGPTAAVLARLTVVGLGTALAGIG
jgi:hypothetical protein